MKNSFLLFLLFPVLSFAQTPDNPNCPGDKEVIDKRFDTPPREDVPDDSEDTDPPNDPNHDDIPIPEFLDTRLIYFLHGLGGSDLSWDAVDDAHMDEYEYTPVRPDYKDHQRDFDEASFETSKSMDHVRFIGLKNEQIKTNKPYVIAHSQGGLVARDMDQKFYNNVDTRFQEKYRQFYGLVTFGTPHLGAKIAVSDQELLKFSSDMCHALTNAVISEELAKIHLKLPFYVKSFKKLESLGSKFTTALCDELIVTGISILSKDQRAKITNQYGPESTYLKNLNKFVNPNLAKGAFYGVEEDPLLWRMATYMVGSDANDQISFGRFGANEDDSIAIIMNDLRLKFLANKSKNEEKRKKLDAKIRLANWPIIGLPNTFRIRKLMNDRKVVEEAIKAEQEASTFIENSDLLYKVIIGAIDPLNMYYQTFDYFLCERRKKGSKMSTFHKVVDPKYCNGTVHTIYKNLLVEFPSDGVVLAESQMAFPGVDPLHVHLMNEKRVRNNDGTYKIVKEGYVNHMQMRNCTQTDAALRRIYNANGLPKFFRIKKIQP